jgi:hypothetical protein
MDCAGFDAQLANHYRETDMPIFAAAKATFKQVIVSISRPVMIGRIQ